jgi:hypothetical protein
MKDPENGEWLNKALTKIIGWEGTKTDFEQWKQNHPEAVEMLTLRTSCETSAWPISQKIRRIIMKNPVTKMTAAAVIVIVFTLGLFEFLGDGGTSGVAWAEVARKVQASKGVIFRSTGRGSEYSTHYDSGTHYRIDCYRGDQLSRTIHGDYGTNTVTYIHHKRRTHTMRTFDDLGQASMWADPVSLILSFLSHEHRELGQKTVEGVLCKGIETTDPTFVQVKFPVDNLVARIWVSVESGYPIRCEGEYDGYNGEDGQLLHHEFVVDQFQWDVDIDPGLFEPNIPPDYQQM